MIPALQASFPDLSLRRLCPLLGLSRSGVCAGWPRAPDAEALALRDAIERIALAFPGYGERRVTHAPKREGWRVNHKRVRRVMRGELLMCQLRRRFVPTTDSRRGLGNRPNLLRDQDIRSPNQAWVADSTDIRLAATFCYLAAIPDAGSSAGICRRTSTRTWPWRPWSGPSPTGSRDRG